MNGNAFERRFTAAMKAVSSTSVLMLGAIAACTPGSNSSPTANAPISEKPTVAEMPAGVETEYATKVLWGDTHLHTSNSFDASAFGVTLDAEAAYRFAKGEEVTSSSGQPARLGRPLDFLVVTDHSDMMGTMDQLLKGNETFNADPELRDLRERLLQGGQEQVQALREIVAVVEGVADEGPAVGLANQQVIQTVWHRYVEAADRHNEPGRFTALIGYEWTPTPHGGNHHRNVIYRDGADLARQMQPFTAAESLNPEDLWAWMQRYEESTGGQLIALAHNANLSQGTMFPTEVNPETGQPLDGDYVSQRARWEPLYEVTQIKGDTEAHPLLSPDDEFASFENWDRGDTGLENLKHPAMLQYEYAREALKNGMALERQLGTNPYRFGMVGSTDSHTGLATADEDNFFGKLANGEPRAGRTIEPMIRVGNNPLFWRAWETSASGYAGVWATENTREAIFDAMKRREVYATSGPRITVRFFGGFDYAPTDATSTDFVRTGYENGVPMGSELSPSEDGQSPRFLIGAMKDPVGANLDRVQVVKGWLDSDGKTHENVFDVVWSDAETRQVLPNGKLPPVGNTVDVENATWDNTIGTAQLSTYWSDPEFDPLQPAFYYVRVLEIPTPRWTVYDAKRFNEELVEDAKTSIQERAYTSPIWYNP